MRPFLPFILFVGLVAGWNVFVQHDPFFWDAVQLGSKHAHYFFENGLRWLVLPEAIDSGHPPVFGYYLAVIWTLFGKTLATSHWAMFPFLLGILIVTFRLGQRLGIPNWSFWLMAIICADPVIASQGASISPDIVLAFFFLLVLEGVLSHKKSLITIGVLGLCAISMRGMMTAGALLVWQMLLAWPWSKPWQIKQYIKIGLPYIPGFAFAAWFILWHYTETGWTAYHPGSPWAPAFEPAQGKALLKNILVLGWRMLDFGRVFEWLVLGVLLYKIGLPKVPALFDKSQLHKLGLLLICLLFFLSPSTILYSNLSAHRYFVPIFLSFHLFLFHWISITDFSVWGKRLLFLGIVIGLGTGNLWIYPRGISIGWDATLAHWPYHSLRAEMIRYIDQENLRFNTIGTAFPNINTGEQLLLNGDIRIFANKDFEENQFILVSNVFNDFSESDYKRLDREWHMVKRVEQSGVWLILYERNQR